MFAGQIDVGYIADNSTTRSPVHPFTRSPGITVYQAGRGKMMVALSPPHYI